MPKIDSIFLAKLRPLKVIRKDLTDQVFHDLTVIECLGRTFAAHGNTYWKCQCICGNVTAADAAGLVNGDTRSCGCRKQNQTHGTTHGQYGTPEHYAWGSMAQRCDNPQHKAFSNYGGRGIVICDGFRDFLIFRAAVGSRPSPDHSLDRENNNGNYSCGECSQCTANGWPLNVRWATKVEQGQNRRGNNVIIAFGKTQVLSEWAKETGKSTTCIRKRIQAGMSNEDALTLPPMRGHRILQKLAHGQANQSHRGSS